MLPRSLLKPLALAILAMALGACSSDTPTGPKQPSLSSTGSPVVVLSKTSFSLCYKQCGGSTRCCTLSYGYLDITNGGGGTLAWTATTDKAWLRTSPSTGTAPSRVKVWVDGTGLTRFYTYFGHITVSASGASNSPQTIWVRVYVP